MKSRFLFSSLATTLVAMTSTGMVRADQMREIDNLAFTAQRQMTTYVRYLKYSVPNNPGSTALMQDAFSIYAGMSEVQKSALFLSNSPREIRDFHRQVDSLAHRVHDAEENIDSLITDLQHREILRPVPSFPVAKPGIHLNLGQGFNVQLGKSNRHPRPAPRNPHAETIAHLRILKGQLVSLHSTLERLDEVFHE